MDHGINNDLSGNLDDGRGSLGVDIEESGLGGLGILGLPHDDKVLRVGALLALDGGQVGGSVVGAVKEAAAANEAAVGGDVVGRPPGGAAHRDRDAPARNCREKARDMKK